MTKSLEMAFAKAAKLSESEQDALAAFLMEELSSERKWDEQFASSQGQLAQLAAEAIGEFRAGRTERMAVHGSPAPPFVWPRGLPKLLETFGRGTCAVGRPAHNREGFFATLRMAPRDHGGRGSCRAASLYQQVTARREARPPGHLKSSLTQRNASASVEP